MVSYQKKNTHPPSRLPIKLRTRNGEKRDKRENKSEEGEEGTIADMRLRYLQATSIRSIRSLVPLLDRVLVQRVKAEAKTASGIFLPESSVEKLNEAQVLAVGPGLLDKKGNRIPMGVSKGDRVLIPQVSTSLGPL